MPSADPGSKTIVARTIADDLETRDVDESELRSIPSDGDVLAEESVTTILDGSQTLREFQKAKDQDACLIMIQGPLQGQRFFLSASEMIVGREPTVDISIADPGISRRHARVSHDKDSNRTTLQDLGSSNGTVVNGEPIHPDRKVELGKEDLIRFGSSLLKYLPAGEYEIVTWGHMDAAAHTDMLTGVSNRRFFTRALDAEFKRARALRRDLSLLYFDIDHFKKFNDTYGHDAGDRLLKQLAGVISNRLGGEAIAFARHGGEEFAILLSDTNADHASTVAGDLQRSVERHRFHHDGEVLRVTISVGVASLVRSIDSPASFLKAADQAMYEAKRTGRNRVVISEPA